MSHETFPYKERTCTHMIIQVPELDNKALIHTTQTERTSTSTHKTAQHTTHKHKEQGDTKLHNTQRYIVYRYTKEFFEVFMF